MKKMSKLAPVLAVVLILAVMAGACGKKGDPVERAKKEILSALVLPPDAKLRDTQANPEQDMLVMSFGTKEKIDVIGELFKKGVADRGYKVLTSSDAMISYQDKAGRQVTAMWFARDPDLSEFPTVFHVSIQPLPKELKNLAPAAPPKDKGK